MTEVPHLGMKSTIQIGYRLFRKSTLAENSNLALGYIWNFAEPISLTIIFAILRSDKVLNINESDYPFFLHLLTGLLPFQLLFTSIQRTTHIIDVNSALLNQVYVPPLSLAASSFFQWVYDSIFVGIVICGCCLLFTSGSFISIVASFFWLQTLGVFAVGIGLILAPLNTIFKDISKIVSLTLRPLMFISPIFYAAKDSTILKTINYYNPFAKFLEGYRALSLGVENNFITTSIAFLTLSTLTMAFGAFFFNRAVPCLNTKS